MIYSDKQAPLLYGRVAHFQKEHQLYPLSTNIRPSIEKLFRIAKLAVDAYDINLSKKCFALADVLLHHGNQQIRSLTRLSFVKIFRQLFNGKETKRLPLFIPADFCDLMKSDPIHEMLQEKIIESSDASFPNITCRVAVEADYVYAQSICQEMHDSAIHRGCGISRREPAQLIEKMTSGKAIIALNDKNMWVGFSYMEVYENGAFVSNSGLIVSPDYRKQGVAWEIKKRVFSLSKNLYPTAKIFSITSGGAVMKMNTELGFEPVCYSEITKDPHFWEGCKSCVNHATLISKNCKNCLCTAMLYKPE